MPAANDMHWALGGRVDPCNLDAISEAVHHDKTEYWPKCGPRNANARLSAPAIALPHEIDPFASAIDRKIPIYNCVQHLNV